MSFLSALQASRKSLKPATTVVTQADGRKYVQTSDSVVLMPETSHGFVVDHNPDDQPAQILHHLYLGSQDCCTNLDKHHINFVLSIGIEAPVKQPSVTYKFVQCLDLPETDLKEVLQETNRFLTDCLPNGKVLVHCNAGVSRSTAVVLGYLILECNYSYEDAFQLVKSVRECVRPNDGFVRQLQQLSN